MRLPAKFATLLIALLGTAHAQVYQCEVDGKRVFTDRPCAKDDTPMQVRPASGDYDPAAGAAAAERLAADLERDRVAAQARREEEQRRAITEANKPRKESRCDQIARERASAERWSREFRHPDNVNRELAKLEHYKERDFMECGRVFD
ncbi:hypothetical protein C0099_11100 [Pseudazoarcus pumilus]|uniref:DUF4124 domain-containing protein n=2 Tax=Pseudazoarcus pumilus TaxID=2067960 RepID=A0A2I6S859_9RHOO|nr:hypothetical protein C0099_11100 [Pseudazoarcus pumilus]